MQPDNPQDDLTGDERELESALARLAPVSTRFKERDVAYRAGQLQARQHIWAYRAIAATLAVALGVSVVFRPRPAVHETERIVYITTTPKTTPVVETASTPALLGPGTDELRLQQALLDKGLAALPPLPAAVHGAARSLDLNSILNGDGL